MKKIILKTLLLTLVVCLPLSATADVRVHVNIPLPLPIILPAPPQLVVIPNTNVYAVPDIAEDIFFYAGWWWRPWKGYWYRSRYYDRDWAYHPHPPSFNRHIPADWKNNYRSRSWQGHRWEPQVRTHHYIQRNWSLWQKEKHWEKQKYGVQRNDRHPSVKYKSHPRKTEAKTVVQYKEKFR
ncbi:MAG: hypothetical protein JW925_13220 [Syntrophaceae bacterium]|nr:hypothetical protein [Syntrophaceae bacterium]